MPCQLGGSSTEPPIGEDAGRRKGGLGGEEPLGEEERKGVEASPGNGRQEIRWSLLLRDAIVARAAR
eukprot:5627796-Pyramimonas_sp.AAC.1